MAQTNSIVGARLQPKNENKKTHAHVSKNISVSCRVFIQWCGCEFLILLTWHFILQRFIWFKLNVKRTLSLDMRIKYFQCVGC